MLVLKEKMKLF